MTLDPVTARQIAQLSDHHDPLLVVDVDEVVLEFVSPFMRFLSEHGYCLKTDSFRLNGNVIERESGEPADKDTVEKLIDDLFANQENWQTAVAGAADVLTSLSDEAAIVLLTAMPHRHHARRRRLLDRLDLQFPLLTTEAAKGPAIAAMRHTPGRPVAFVDDIPHNLVSVQNSVPDASLFHLMSFEPFKAVMPELPDGIVHAPNWPEAEALIARALGIGGG